MSGCIAIISARGGSKRLPRKNIYPLFDKPLIAWGIEAARAAACLDDIYVSTDDPEIDTTARQYGAGVIRRPDNLCDDITPKMEAIRHAFNTLDKDGQGPDVIVSLQANSPELRSSDIDRCVTLLKERNLWEVFSVSADGVQNSAIRVLHRDCLFNTFLSAHIGVVHPSCLDVHTLDDIRDLARRYSSAEGLMIDMRS